MAGCIQKLRLPLPSFMVVSNMKGSPRSSLSLSRWFPRARERTGRRAQAQPCSGRGGQAHHGTMMTLHYTGDTVLLDDDVCDAVLRYAQALADAQSSDVVAVPMRTPDGEQDVVEFLLGPSSQLYATHAAADVREKRHPEVVDDLDRRTQLLHPTAVVAPRSSSLDLEFDSDAG